MSKIKKMFSLAIHGGAGDFSKKRMSKDRERAYGEMMLKTLDAGVEMLKQGRASVDVVTETVMMLEDNPLFNAGKGSVFTRNGDHAMDAAIMNGKNLMAGSVAGIHTVRNPIRLAREIMEKSDHVMLSGEDALRFARLHHIKMEPKEYFYDELRYQQWQKAVLNEKIALEHDEDEDEKFGTVGAVAMDMDGNLAAATSTGGMVNKNYGRIGDTPIIGAGTYADNEACAVSCTGHGEYFIRMVVAHDLVSLIKYKNMHLDVAAAYVINEKLASIKGRGGLIAVDKHGNIAMPYNTNGMFRAFARENGEQFYSLF